MRAYNFSLVLLLAACRAGEGVVPSTDGRRDVQTQDTDTTTDTDTTDDTDSNPGSTGDTGITVPPEPLECASAFDYQTGPGWGAFFQQPWYFAVYGGGSYDATTGLWSGVSFDIDVVSTTGETCNLTLNASAPLVGELVVDGTSRYSAGVLISAMTVDNNCDDFNNQWPTEALTDYFTTRQFGVAFGPNTPEMDFLADWYADQVGATVQPLGAYWVDAANWSACPVGGLGTDAFGDTLVLADGPAPLPTGDYSWGIPGFQTDGALLAF